MKVGILEGGLQGSLIALALARRGVAVEILEKRSQLIAAASAQNEGKIHLGYVYANDRSLATARMMIRGALSFGPVLNELLDGAFSELPVSRPFNYLVHHDSLLSDEATAAHFAAVDALAAEALAHRGNYLGETTLPTTKPRPIQKSYGTQRIAAAFTTGERAVDPQALAAIVRRKLASEPNIAMVCGATVRSVRLDD